jgi:predicted DNA-binding transcriptional regulator YafY
VSRPLLPCESPVSLITPRMDVLAPVCRAIHARCPVAIRYYSMSSGESERVIVPFALVDTGIRWHVRAFDRTRHEFRDFVLTRIEEPFFVDEVPEVYELPENDIQWTRIVELELVPHPRLNRPEIVRKEYGINDHSLKLRVRAAVAGYMLLRWNVDSSPDHCLTDEHYRLWLCNPLTLYGVENAQLAPGYCPPVERIER